MLLFYLFLLLIIASHYCHLTLERSNLQPLVAPLPHLEEIVCFNLWRFFPRLWNCNFYQVQCLFGFSLQDCIPSIEEKTSLIIIIIKFLGKNWFLPKKTNNNMRLNDADEAAIFWGLENYNKMLLQAGNSEPGSVMTDMLIRKDPESFTLRNGWAFPRKVYFNGESCEMPMPNDYPALPNTSPSPSNACYLIIILFSLILLFQ